MYLYVLNVVFVYIVCKDAAKSEIHVDNQNSAIAARLFPKQLYLQRKQYEFVTSQTNGGMGRLGEQKVEESLSSLIHDVNDKWRKCFYCLKYRVK